MLQTEKTALINEWKKGNEKFITAFKGADVCETISILLNAFQTKIDMLLDNEISYEPTQEVKTVSTELSEAEPTEDEIAEFKEKISAAILDISKISNKTIANKIVKEYETLVIDGVVKKLGLNLSSPYDYDKLMEMKETILKNGLN